MKKLFLAVMLVIVFGSFSFAEESKEVISLKREVIQERIMRITAELEVIKIRFRDGQIALQDANSELKGIDVKLKSMDSKTKQSDKGK
jgi:Skp family chaperone for outer membrane proteins